jgi:hypothetical protein
MAFGPDLLVSAKLSPFTQQLQFKNQHGLAPMGLHEPVPLCNITHQTHMDNIQ